MMKRLIRLLFAVMLGFMLISCAVQKPEVRFTPYDFMPDVLRGLYAKKVDNFEVILDASSSMDESYGEQSKFGLAKGTVSRMNQTLPELDFFCGLRTFGQSHWPFSKKTTLVYGMTEYSKAEFQGALEAVKPVGGISPLARAIDAASGDLKTTQGSIAVIIVSDGEEMDRTPVTAAQQMAATYGDRLCIYTVLVGKDPAGKKLLEDIGSVGPCGFSVDADQLLTSQGMADFVEKVFLTKQARDQDGDGVPDELDQCPDTPSGVAVDARGCPLDSDGDGVYDYLDRCPDTPAGVMVDKGGCPLDSDGDGVYDYLDKCPGTPAGVPVDGSGCPQDSDGDGVPDYLDRCPNTPANVPVDEDGCPPEK